MLCRNEACYVEGKGMSDAEGKGMSYTEESGVCDEKRRHLHPKSNKPMPFHKEKCILIVFRGRT